MAKGNVKKGFASYLLILFVAILAAFLIIVTIMFFSPFKGILGFKYFRYGDTSIIVNPTGKTEEEFDFRNVENIDIDCNFANVAIERRVKAVNYGGFEVKNVCSGFAREDQETDFFFEAAYQDDEKKSIKVTVREPEGFLFFSKNITITLIVSDNIAESFENTNININTTKGYVYLGNVHDIQTEMGKEANGLLKFKSISTKNTTGKVVMFKNVVSIGDLLIKTTKGSVETRNSLEVNNFNINSNSGRLEFKNVIANYAKLDLNNSSFSAQDLTVNKLGNLSIKDGYFDVVKLGGALTSSEMVGSISKSQFNIDKLDGTFSLPNANKSIVNIDEVTSSSQLHVRGTSGKVNVKNCSGKAWIEMTSGNVNAEVKNTFVSINTTSGDINLKYLSDTTNGLEILSSSGAVDLQVKQGLKFVLDVFNTKGERRESGVRVETFDKNVELPLQMYGGTETIKIVTDKSVSVSFQ